MAFSPLCKPGRGLIYYTAWAFAFTGRNINLKYSTAAESMCLNSQNLQRNLQQTLAYFIHLLIHREQLIQFSWRESSFRIQRHLSAPEFFFFFFFFFVICDRKCIKLNLFHPFLLTICSLMDIKIQRCTWNLCTTKVIFSSSLSIGHPFRLNKIMKISDNLSTGFFESENSW